MISVRLADKFHNAQCRYRPSGLMDVGTSRSTTIRTRLRVPRGAPLNFSAGLVPEPSQVNWGGRTAFCSKLGLAICRLLVGIVLEVGGRGLGVWENATPAVIEPRLRTVAIPA